MTPPPAGNVGDVAPLPTSVPGFSVAYDSDEGTVLYDFDALIWSVTPSLYDNIPAARIMTYDAAGHRLLMTDGQSIYAIPFRGTLTTIATGFANASSITTDPSGTIYVVDVDHVSTVVGGKPRQLTPSGSVAWHWGFAPSITFDSRDGNLYVSDPGYDRIDRVSTSGSVSTLVGRCVHPQSPPGCDALDREGDATHAIFGEPSAIAYDAATNALYMADTFNNQIWKIDPQGNSSVFVGYGYPGATSGNGRFAFIDAPTGLAIDQFGRLFFHGGSEVAAVSLRGSSPATQTFPGSAFWSPTFKGSIDAVVSDRNGGAWSSLENDTVYEHIDATGNVTEYPLNGYGASLASDSSGNAWVGATDVLQANQRIDEITPAGQVSTYPTSAVVHAVALGNDGNVWFTERYANGGNGSVASVSPQTKTLNEYSIPPSPTPQPGYPAFPTLGPGTIFQGPNSEMWFLSWGWGRIAGGQLQPFYSLPSTAIDYVTHDAADDSVWFTDTVNLYKLSSTATIVKTIPVCSGCTFGPLAATPDGYVWTLGGDYLVRYDTNGNGVVYPLPMAAPTIGIDAAPDNTLWIATEGGEVVHFNPALYDAAKLPHAVRRAGSLARRTRLEAGFRP